MQTEKHALILLAAGARVLWMQIRPARSKKSGNRSDEMKALILLLTCCGVFSACTSVTVRRPDPNLLIKNVCIQENPKVWVSDFLPVLKEGFARHSIATTIYSEAATKPTGCQYVLTYTARQSWDFAPYLSYAELWLEKDGQQIGYAEYHLIGKGGFSLMKWEGTKTKMDPVIDDLLGNVSNAAKPKEAQQAEDTQAEAGR